MCARLTYNRGFFQCPLPSLNEGKDASFDRSGPRRARPFRSGPSRPMTGASGQPLLCCSHICGNRRLGHARRKARAGNGSSRGAVSSALVAQGSWFCCSPGLPTALVCCGRESRHAASRFAPCCVSLPPPSGAHRGSAPRAGIAHPRPHAAEFLRRFSDSGSGGPAHELLERLFRSSWFDRGGLGLRVAGCPCSGRRCGMPPAGIRWIQSRRSTRSRWHPLHVLTPLPFMRPLDSGCELFHEWIAVGPDLGVSLNTRHASTADGFTW
jgi:hypothetical protein